MKWISRLILLGGLGLGVWYLTQWMGHTPSLVTDWEALSQTVGYRLRMLETWTVLYVGGVAIGVIEGLDWRRRERFAGYQRGLMRLSWPISAALGVVVWVWLVKRDPLNVNILLALVAGLLCSLGFVLSAGRPTMR